MGGPAWFGVGMVIGFGVLFIHSSIVVYATYRFRELERLSDAYYRVDPHVYGPIVLLHDFFSSPTMRWIALAYDLAFLFWTIWQYGSGRFRR
jgi:hypothetical protein